MLENALYKSCGFGHIYCRNPWWKTLFFVQWRVFSDSYFLIDFFLIIIIIIIIIIAVVAIIITAIITINLFQVD